MSRRARTATDDVFDRESARAWVSTGSARDDSARAAPVRETEDVWGQLARELDRANRPGGRATTAVREVVRRIVRELRADGASSDEIRGALARAVRRYHKLLGETQGDHDMAVSESLLADVLHCAAMDDASPGPDDLWHRQP